MRKVVTPPFNKVEDVCLACGSALKYRFDLNRLRSLNAYLKACSDGKAKTPMAAEGQGVFAFLHSVLNVYHVKSTDDCLLKAAATGRDALIKVQACCPENLVSGGWAKIIKTTPVLQEIEMTKTTEEQPAPVTVE